jgi:hypothetical protein
MVRFFWLFFSGFLGLIGFFCSPLPVLDKGADFVGVGDKVIVAIIIGIMAIVMLQVSNLDSTRTVSHLVLVSSLGSKETDLEAITEL